MADADSEIERKIKAAFTAVDDAYHDDHGVAYGSLNDRKRHLFDMLRKRKKAWDRAGPCMVRGCTESTIKRSHTLHRSGPLRTIAEDGHVLGPALDKDGVLHLEEIGIGLASTFPGFCERHEAMFTEFESVGAISTPRHILLQTFRSTCREISMKEHQLENYQAALVQHRSARTEYYRASLERELPEAKVGSVEIEGDPIEQMVLEGIETLQRDIKLLRDGIYTETLDSIETGADKSCLTGKIVPIPIPACVSGIGVINFARDGVREDALCIMNVIPQGAGTALSIATTVKHCELIGPYDQILSVALPMLSAVESWMVNGTDHWFIRPSIWNAIPETRRVAILEAVSRPGDNILYGTPFSIFDGLRDRLIRLMEKVAKKTNTATAEFEAMIAAERAKLVA